MSYFRDVLPPLHLFGEGDGGCRGWRRGDLGSWCGRDEPTSVMKFVREGDELVVLKLDRLGRNTPDVLKLVHELGRRTCLSRHSQPRMSPVRSWSRYWGWSPNSNGALRRIFRLSSNSTFIRERQKAGILGATLTEWGINQRMEGRNKAILGTSIGRTRACSRSWHPQRNAASGATN